MKFERSLIDKLAEELKQPLPGEEIRYRMAPPYRPKLTKEEIMEHHPKIGAVLLLLYEKDNRLMLVFTQRRQYEGVHSGQMSLPGGKKDKTDTDLIQTALRETHEEIGIAPAQVNILGHLTELYIPPSNFLVYPTVGFMETAPQFTPHEVEVEKVVEIPVSFFMDPANINLETEIQIFKGTKVKVPAYIYGQHTIWGATALILSEFTYLVEKIVL